MSEYWKSTPKYWCKHCSVFVRDTKLERTNHEATGKHQGAIKRSLRDIHRNAEQQEREKERVRREIERLNGAVDGGSSGSAASGASNNGASKKQQQSQQPQQKVSEAERQKQLEQLAELGVNIPTELRGNMAMAGEWTVTATRVIREGNGDAEGVGEKKEGEMVADQARATGVKRERERTEEEKEQEEAIKGLFAKRRKWGVDSKRMPCDDDAELDALLSGPLPVKKEETPPIVKKEESQDGAESEGGDQPGDTISHIKKEPSGDEAGLDGVATQPGVGADASPATDEAEPAAVMFKKRKPKNIRQK